MPFISRIDIPGDNPPAVYQITIQAANILLIAGEELTLIDTGRRDSASRIFEYIRELGRRPEEVSLIILTHNHIDHVGGLPELKAATGAKVAVHRTDVGERKNLPSAKPEYVDIRLEGGEILGEANLEVVHTPGHTPGSISLFSAKHRLLIAGDAIRKRRDSLELPFETASFDRAQAIESVKKMSLLDPRVLCFGHGLPAAEDIKSRMVDLLKRTRD